jgi:hypothetical protein
VWNVLDVPRAAYVARVKAAKDKSSNPVAMVTRKANDGLAHSDRG